MSMRKKKIPIQTLERIDDLCAEFERKWQSDQPPMIESLLDGEPEREVLLSELLALDIDYRRQRGEAPTQQEYLARFPDDRNAIQEALKEPLKPTGAFEPPSAERIAELFPNLKSIELIGVGGMGAVYKARQEGLDRVIALKVLPEEFGHDVKFALRFTREARTLAKLNHPNIVSVYEFGHNEDTYYFFMEYVEGPTLRDVVRARELAPEHAISIVPALCDALQYAHDQAVVHRDIKPENILLSLDGSVKIADFGLSRIVGGESQQSALTATHQVMGTPRYMAPEQMEGAHSVDHRADIYSLGVVIYEMLTGELPIGRFAAPSTKAQIDVRLDEVVLRTLEKEPQRRYQHASHIKSDVISITGSSNETPPAAAAGLAHTIAQPGQVPSESGSGASLHDQELAGRLLLTRGQLMKRVESALRPLFRAQVFQIFVGVALIILGAQCWARSSLPPAWSSYDSTQMRLLCGIILHVYGVIVIAYAANVCTKIRRIDHTESLVSIRGALDTIRKAYLRNGLVIGFPWWLMWLPTSVALGFDQVTHPNSLYVSLAVGIVGWVASVVLYCRVLRPGNPSAESWRQRLAGTSIAAASQSLDEIQAAGIQ
ncbi:MAG: serine/threonine-protein kinase [Aureliella sp.]